VTKKNTHFHIIIMHNDFLLIIGSRMKLIELTSPL